MNNLPSYLSVEHFRRNNVVDVWIISDAILFVSKGECRIPLHHQERFLHGLKYFVTEAAMNMLDSDRLSDRLSDLVFINGDSGPNVCVTKDEAKQLGI